MTLANVKAGDIVQADGSYALVRDKRRGELLISWLSRSVSINGDRWIKAREVECHWSRRR